VIEDKLDDLVSLIRASHQTGPGVAVGSLPNLQDALTKPFEPVLLQGIATANSLESSQDTTHQKPGQTIQAATPATTAPSSLSHGPASPFSDGGYGISLPEAIAEEHLRAFQAIHLRYFPLFHIAATTTAKQLATEFPFLWLNIVSVTTSNPTEQGNLGNKVKEILARQLIIEDTRSIDLFMGLLIHISW
jgi:hypothetical protein